MQLALLTGPAFLAYSFTAPCLWYWEQAFVLWCCVGLVLATARRAPETAPTPGVN